MEVNLEAPLDRRLFRKQETRWHFHKDILLRWNTHVLPCNYKYLAPYKKIADFSFVNDSNFDVKIKRLKKKIDHRLTKCPTNQF